ncbi:MAG TPA: trypsin-like peptidase domain-containing protein [Acidothermaceae bacterium]|nr:trypsin-like peptidase domain-containing protein [Acidothermaceae bacterium]
METGDENSNTPGEPTEVPPPWWSRADELLRSGSQPSADTPQLSGDAPRQSADASGSAEPPVPSAETPASATPPAPSATPPFDAAPSDTPLFDTAPFDTAPLYGPAAFDASASEQHAMHDGPSDVVSSDASDSDGNRSRRAVRQAALITVAAVVISAAASGTVVHIVDDHSGNGSTSNTAASTPAGTATGSAASPSAASSSGASSSATSSLPPAAQVAADVKTALARIEPSIVLINDTITSSPSGRGGFGGFGGFEESGAGTGIIISSDGEIVTNAHVVNGATAITVTFSGSSTTHPATIVGINTTEDLAVIKVSGVSNLKPATFANSDTAEVGDSVLAVGNALGYGGAPTVTEGILSAKGRSLTGTDDNLSNLLQTDAAINPGNSGGPLVDTDGQVIGIDVAVASGTTTEPAQNIGFAIPSNTVVSALPALKAGQGASTQGGGSTTQPGTFLGVSVADATGGALVQAVEPGSPAATAGIQAGDLITSINGTAVADGTALQQAIRAQKPGTTVTVGITRNGASITVKATLGTTQLSS